MIKRSAVTHRFVVVVVAVSCCFPWLLSSAAAQNVEGQSEFTAIEPRTFETVFGYDHLFDASLDKDGRFHRDSTLAVVRLNATVNPRLSAGAFFKYEYDSYDFSSNSPFQWDEIHTFHFGPKGSIKLSDRVKLLGAGSFSYSAEDDADFGEALTVGGAGGILFTQSENLSIGLAIGVTTQIEEDVAVIPVPLINWQIVPNLRLRTGSLEVGGRFGLGAALSYRVSQSVDLTGGFQFQRRRFRTNTDDEVGEDTSVPVFFKLTLEPAEWVQIEGVVGCALAGDLRREDSDGDRIESEDYNPAVFVGGNLNFRF